MILRVGLKANQSRDIAVFEIEKRNNNNTASIQIVGDVDLYWSDYNIESQTMEGQKKQDIQDDNGFRYN